MSRSFHSQPTSMVEGKFTGFKDTISKHNGCNKSTADITAYGAFFVPGAVESDAKTLSVLLLVPHQKLLSGFNGSTATVENLPLILKRHQILLFVIRSTIHISEIRNKEKTEILKDRPQLA